MNINELIKQNEGRRYEFSKLVIFDQWGNGLKLISDELKDYLEIDF